MQARYPDFLQDKLMSKEHSSDNFVNFRWKPAGIFIALIGFSSLAHANCSEALLNKLIDNNFSPAQVMQLCSGVTALPPAGVANTSPAAVLAEVKPAADQKPAANPVAPADKNKEADQKTVISAPAKDISFEGDYIYIGNEVKNFTDINSGDENLTAKAGSKFRVDKEQKQVNGTHTLVVTRSQCGEASDKIVGFFDSEYQCAAPTAEDTIKEHRIYSVKKEDIMYGNYLHRGFGWGIMVSPFKFYPKGKTLAPGNSIGPYLSYLYDKPGVSFGPAVSLSYTSLPVTTIQNGVSNTTNQNGLTVAAGFLFRIKDQFTIGIMAGRDYIDSQYKYNGATWFGANFGYELGQ